jgi:hypothetical protein
VDVEAAGEYELSAHQLGSESDDDVEATGIESRGHSFEIGTGSENRRRLL